VIRPYFGRSASSRRSRSARQRALPFWCSVTALATNGPEDQRECRDHHAIDQPAGRTEPPDRSSSRERDSTLLVTEPAAAELPASMVVTRRDVEVAGLDAPVAAAEVAPR
jgi:hypothetical protein